MKVLVLSCNTGGGHNSCAGAIQEAFAARGDVCDIADSLRFISQKLSRFVSWGHTTMYRHIPGLFRSGYGFFEKHPGMLQKTSAVYKLLTSGAAQLSTFLSAGRYDAVICTHVFSGLLLSATLQSHPAQVSTAFVATDYTCSPGVAISALDVYFIPSAALAKEFAEQGVPEGKQVTSGIPINARFYQKQDKANAKVKHHIAPSHSHLLMTCGSMGCGPLKKLTVLLGKQLDERCEVSIVCGTNEKLRRTLARMCKNKKNFHIYGFIDDMASMMDSADVYLTKPGGLSTTEAAAKNLPMVFIDAVAGCEEYNAQYFVGTGGALAAPTLRELTELCAGLLTDPEKRKRLEQALLAQEQKNAASCICEVMCDRAKGGQP